MKRHGAAAEVFGAFLWLGLTSFGGPVAHLGYFRAAFVERRQWLAEADYAALVSLCQFLPGPASSQTGFCIGLTRAGWRGGLAAWVGFTLPSALLMWAVAEAAGWLDRAPLAGRVLHGMQLAAIAVVAQAVVAMARGLCPDLPRRLIAAAALGIAAAVPGFGGQLLVLLLGAAAGGVALRPSAVAVAAATPPGVSRRAAGLCLVAFGALLLFSLFGWRNGNLALFAAFYRAGALVFGGGHVVLPLLQTAVVAPGWVAPNVFLAGYGVAQAMPGPLFTFAAFLGAVSAKGAGGAAGATIAVLGIFLPGLLLAAGLLPHWHGLRRNAIAAAIFNGVNAAVVGLLGHALLTLVQHGPRGPADFFIVIVATLALILWRAPPILVVALCALAALI